MTRAGSKVRDMSEKLGVDKVGVGVLCGLACITAGLMYLFSFGNAPLATESLFWAAPILSPIAFLVYLRWERAGAIVMLLLYAAAVTGSSRMLQSDCGRGDCVTQNRVVITLASMVAGFHMMFMLVALVWMCAGVWRARRLA